jgi:hypothetical protein
VVDNKDRKGLLSGRDLSLAEKDSARAKPLKHKNYFIFAYSYKN